MNNRMKINQPLPPDFADKWKRLLAFQGGDPEALALAAVELLWKKYGRDVERQERAQERMDRQIEKTKKRLSTICPKERCKSQQDCLT